MKRHLPLFIAIVCISLLMGCAVRPVIENRPERAAAFFKELDHAVGEAGVPNAAAVPVPGFPYLRANRFLASFVGRQPTDAERVAWINALQQLDLKLRESEIAALKPDRVSRDTLMAETVRASDELRRHDAADAEYADKVGEAIRIPDEYCPVMRFMGLYPLAAIPVTIVTHNVWEEFMAWHRTPADNLPVIGRLSVSGPPETTPVDWLPFWESLPRNALGMPRISEADGQVLAARFAPVVIQDTAIDDDRWGAMKWGVEGPVVDGESPTVYYAFSGYRYDDQPALQILYTLWYPGRSGPQAPWIENGRLDGLTVRISLDPSGDPVMVDIMNNCGCYHFYVPSARHIARPVRPKGSLAPLVPRWLPEAFPEARLSLRINSGWHQVQHIDTVSGAGFERTYALAPYDRLEALQKPSGAVENLFDAEGIAKGSARIEPYIFFSMGIPRIGSMRQRGHHAVQLVGHAHFDDPYLFDTFFEFHTAPVRKNRHENSGN